MGRKTTSFACGTLVGALAAFLAWAEESAEAAQEGLPQLNPAHFPEQLFWLAVTFALLYVCMRYIALPNVQRTQDTRAQKIAGDLAAAQASNEDAKNMMVKYEKALADARAQARATVGEIAAKAAQESAAKQAAQRQQLAKRLAEAEAKIAEARDAAVKDIKGTASSLADAIFEKVTGGKSHAPARGSK